MCYMEDKMQERYDALDHIDPTDYEKLADWVVSQGVGAQDYMGEYKGYWIESPNNHGNHGWWTAEQFCHDWRVVGAMMEKLLDQVGNRRVVIMLTDRVIAKYLAKVSWYFGSQYGPRHSANNDSLPLAILTAIYEAMNDG